jgi:hypothetical protein
VHIAPVTCLLSDHDGDSGPEQHVSFVVFGASHLRLIDLVPTIETRSQSERRPPPFTDWQSIDPAVGSST